MLACAMGFLPSDHFFGRQHAMLRRVRKRQQGVMRTRIQACGASNRDPMRCQARPLNLWDLTSLALPPATDPGATDHCWHLAGAGKRRPMRERSAVAVKRL